MIESAPRTQSNLYTSMTRSHDYLRELFARVLMAVENDAPDVRDRWDELEHGLRSDMEAEERFVLPTFARSDCEEARELLREHGAIREQLLELGVAIDLHCVRFERFHHFIEMVRRHAGREELLLYRWAGQGLTPDAIEAILQRVPTR